MEIDGSGLEVLEHDECLRLLATATLGRVGLSLGALASVLPVNFWLDGDRILVRTRPLQARMRRLHNAVVAFEVDDFDPIYHSGVAVPAGAKRWAAPNELSWDPRTLVGLVSQRVSVVPTSSLCTTTARVATGVVVR